MKIVAVTGASGYLAEGLIQKLTKEGYHINAISRNEGGLISLKEKFKNVSIFPCPIEDYCLLKKALKNVIGVYHLASVKDVVLSEENPLKTVQTNIIGTLNILDLSLKLSNIKFVIVSSTDKAEKVSSVYGATKFIIEKLFNEYSSINENCKYRVVRFGNIFNSTGSVLIKWKKAINENKELLVTDLNATRFFITREFAVDLIFSCLKKSENAKPFFKTMKSIDLQTLLDVVIEKYALNKPKVKIIGLQDGENVHELFNNFLDSSNAEKWSYNDLLKIV